MPRPPNHYANPKKLTIVDVVIDPVLSNHLRPHQKEGVQFLYECTMGYRDFDGKGAILADDMGLGKSIQAITLVWTLIKQNPLHGVGSVCKRALIVCPASLVGNWQNEFRKWLGDERCKTFPVDAKTNLQDFLQGRVYQVMIIGYERLRALPKIAADASFDLIICDEGHRLKSESSQTTQVLMSIPTIRRVILSGTPIQNDLQEFYNMVSFVNDCLGSSTTFRKVFGDAILAGRQPNASKKVQDLGQARSEELTRLTSLFILRRTQQVNQQYLPPKTELVVFSPPTKVQVNLYHQILKTLSMDESFGPQHFRCITALKKLCNHPTLLAENEDVNDVPMEFSVNDSSKMTMLKHLLANVKPTGDCIVLVSNYTQTLDLFEHVCATEGYSFLRLDGSTPSEKRTELVTRFNAPHCSIYVFLLSTKAGGQGLNLIGANRLVLYDIDWNPAMDLQAQARIWRDGQRKPVVIYRFLTSGTIEEKIYQRQITKIALSEALLDEKNSEQKFTQEELRNLFSFCETGSETKELLDSVKGLEEWTALDDSSVKQMCKAHGLPQSLVSCLFTKSAQSA